jgi:hypothetical protein
MRRSIHAVSDPRALRAHARASQSNAIEAARQQVRGDLNAEKQRAIDALNQTHSAEKQRAIDALNQTHSAEKQRAIDALNQTNSAEKQRAIDALNQTNSAEKQRAIDTLRAQHTSLLQNVQQASLAESARLVQTHQAKTAAQERAHQGELRLARSPSRTREELVEVATRIHRTTSPARTHVEEGNLKIILEGVQQVVQADETCGKRRYLTSYSCLVFGVLIGIILMCFYYVMTLILTNISLAETTRAKNWGAVVQSTAVAMKQHLPTNPADAIVPVADLQKFKKEAAEASLLGIDAFYRLAEKCMDLLTQVLRKQGAALAAGNAVRTAITWGEFAACTTNPVIEHAKYEHQLEQFKETEKIKAASESTQKNLKLYYGFVSASKEYSQTGRLPRVLDAQSADPHVQGEQMFVRSLGVPSSKDTRLLVQTVGNATLVPGGPHGLRVDYRSKSVLVLAANIRLYGDKRPIVAKILARMKHPEAAIHTLLCSTLSKAVLGELLPIVAAGLPIQSSDSPLLRQWMQKSPQLLDVCARGLKEYFSHPDVIVLTEKARKKEPLPHLDFGARDHGGIGTPQAVERYVKGLYDKGNYAGLKDVFVQYARTMATYSQKLETRSGSDLLKIVEFLRPALQEMCDPSNAFLAEKCAQVLIPPSAAGAFAAAEKEANGWFAGMSLERMASMASMGWNFVQNAPKLANLASSVAAAAGTTDNYGLARAVAHGERGILAKTKAVRAGIPFVAEVARGAVRGVADVAMDGLLGQAKRVTELNTQLAHLRGQLTTAHSQHTTALAAGEASRHADAQAHVQKTQALEARHDILMRAQQQEHVRAIEAQQKDHATHMLEARDIATDYLKERDAAQDQFSAMTAERDALIKHLEESIKEIAEAIVTFQTDASPETVAVLDALELDMKSILSR